MSHAVRVTGHVREEVKVLTRLGFTYSHHDSRSHPVFSHPRHGQVTVPNSPSKQAWKRGLRRKVAACMGITVVELEALLAGQAVVGKRSNAHRRPPRGRKAKASKTVRHLKPVPAAPVVPAVVVPTVEAKPVPVFSPADPITHARRALWAANEAERRRAEAQARNTSPLRSQAA